MAFRVLSSFLEAEYFAGFLVIKTVNVNTTPNTSLIRLPIARKIKLFLGGHQKEDDRTGSSCSVYWL